MTEHQEQAQIVQWFKLQFPKLTMFAIPNGAHLAGDDRLRAIKMARMKSEGFVNGVSDLFLMAPKGKWHGLFIEMKSKTGKVSKEQMTFIQGAVSVGYCAVVCHGFDEAKQAIEDYLR